MLAATGLPLFLTTPVQYGYEFSNQDFQLRPAARSLARQLTLLANTSGARFPDKTLVGAAGMHALFLLAHVDTAFSAIALRRMKAEGPKEAPPPDVATLEDRLRSASGQKQIYGTQLMLDAKNEPKELPVEDSVHVDARRAAVGLPPLATSLCLARDLK
jgi:hypothetical protein